MNDKELTVEQEVDAVTTGILFAQSVAVLLLLVTDHSGAADYFPLALRASDRVPLSGFRIDHSPDLWPANQTELDERLVRIAGVIRECYFVECAQASHVVDAINKLILDDLEEPTDTLQKYDDPELEREIRQKAAMKYARE